MAALVFAVYFIEFGTMFPQVEYRVWLDFPFYFLDLWHFAFSPGSISNRGFSFYAVIAIADACDRGIVCDNVVLLLVMALAAFFMALALGILSRWRHPVALAVAVAFAALSEPWIETAHWQSTALDRFAAFFTAGAVLLYAIGLRLEFARRVLFGNSILLVVIVLGYNSKEAAWTLLPSLLLLGFLAEAEDGWLRAALRSVATLALPIVYVGYLSLRLLFRHVDPAENAHNLSGSAGANIANFAGYLLNSASLQLAAALVILISVAGLAVLWRARADRAILTLAMWSAASLAMSLLPPLFTQYGAPFYLMVPSLYLAALLFVLMAAAIEAARGRRLAAAVVWALVLALFAHHLYLFERRLGVYRPMLIQSNNLKAALPSIAAATGDRAEPILALVPSQNHMAFRLVEVGFGRYMFGAGERARSFDRRYRYAVFRDNPDEVPSDGAIRIIFDETMNLVRIDAPR